MTALFVTMMLKWQHYLAQWCLNDSIIGHKDTLMTALIGTIWRLYWQPYFARYDKHMQEISFLWVSVITHAKFKCTLFFSSIYSKTLHKCKHIYTYQKCLSNTTKEQKPAYIWQPLPALVQNVGAWPPTGKQNGGKSQSHIPGRCWGGGGIKIFEHELSQSK